MGLEAWRKAIRQIESSGNYTAKGPVVKKGRYAGDRAYGAYQVMGKNVGPWTKQVLGRAYSPNEFLKSRAAQDAVFDGMFGANYKKHGGADAASIWHSGSTLAAARARHATDGYSTTEDYVNRASQYATGQKAVSAAAANGVAGPLDSGALETSLADGTTAAATPHEMNYVAVLDSLRNFASQSNFNGSNGRSNPSNINAARLQSSVM